MLTFTTSPWTVEIDFTGASRISFKLFFGDCGVMRPIPFKESSFGTVIICPAIIFVCLDRTKRVPLTKKFLRVRERPSLIWLNFVSSFNVAVMALVASATLKFSIWPFSPFELLKVAVWPTLITHTLTIVVGYGAASPALHDSNYFRVLYCI